MADEEPLNPPPPEPLGPHGEMLWRSIADVYELRPDEVRTLCNAAKLADQVAKMEEVLMEAGKDLMVPGSRPGTWQAHPLLSEIRLCRQVMSQLLARLDIPEDGDEEDDRPMTASELARKAARARWDKRRRHG